MALELGEGDSIMASKQFERIRDAILNQRYTLTEHAYEEMEDDNLDVLDVESAVLTGRPQADADEGSAWHAIRNRRHGDG